MKRWAALIAIVLLPSQAATPAGNDTQERARITAERQAAEASYAAQVRECQQRFAVTPCIETARATRRERLIDLRRQQSLLDEAQRKQKAAERMDAIRAKVSAEEARQQQPPSPAARQAPMRVVAPRAGRAASAPDAPAPAASAARAAAEARSRARYEERQREAQAHRDDVARRAAQRAAGGKHPAAPLPKPPASAP